MALVLFTNVIPSTFYIGLPINGIILYYYVGFFKERPFDATNITAIFGPKPLNCPFICITLNSFVYLHVGSKLTIGSLIYLKTSEDPELESHSRLV